MYADWDLQMINQRYRPNISRGINAAIKTLLTPNKRIPILICEMSNIVNVSAYPIYSIHGHFTLARDSVV